MKSALLAAAWVTITVSTGAFPLYAQLQDNSEKRMTCENSGNRGDRARHCEIREQTIPATGRLSADAGGNGGATVKGWLRSEVLVRARIETSADTQATADLLASQVSIAAAGGQVQAVGPQSGENSQWSVSYEIFVPQNTDLTLKAVNGGLSVSDVRGQIRVDTTNGGVQLTRVAGDVSGGTVNGGIRVELAGTMWDGRQLELKTQNGGVSVSLPSLYSAHVQAETVVGHITSDFPATTAASSGRRLAEFNVGSGGALIHVSTRNGGVSLKRLQ